MSTPEWFLRMLRDFARNAAEADRERAEADES